MSRRTHPILAPALTALAIAVTVPLTACGGGGEDTLPAPSLEQWQGRVNGFCSDGVQETLALVPAKTTRQIPNDAQARAEILANVRDESSPLPRPEGYNTQIETWIAGLDADIKLLGNVAREATNGGDYLTTIGELDASTGDAAAALDLPACQQLSISDREHLRLSRRRRRSVGTEQAGS